MPSPGDYSREAWRRRRTEGDETIPRRRPSHQYWDSPHDHMPPVRRVNFVVIFFGLGLTVMLGITLYMLFTLASLLPK